MPATNTEDFGLLFGWLQQPFVLETEEKRSIKKDY